LFTAEGEETLRARFRKNGFMTKQDLASIVRWKFQGRLLGRQRRILKLTDEVRDSFARDVSRLAFSSKDDRTRLELLSSIKGIGNALSSVILTFYDPKRHGVLDIHAWRGLFGEKEPKDVFQNPRRAIRYFYRLREISQQTGLICRDIEKGIFQKRRGD